MGLDWKVFVFRVEVVGGKPEGAVVGGISLVEAIVARTPSGPPCGARATALDPLAGYA